MESKYRVPSGVVGKANAAGEIGRQWLKNLDALVDELVRRWNVRLGNVMDGGTHALVIEAFDAENVPCVLKIEIPDGEEGDFLRGIRVLEAADGHGYARLYARDVQNRAVLLEKLGTRMRLTDIPVNRQMEIICGLLEETWRMKMDTQDLPDGRASVDWFRGFLSEMWEELGRPCSERVIAQAMRFLDAREANLNSAEYVILHGDAHNNNTLQTLSGDFKLIDPECIFYEKAYDLGVLMREWPGEYRESPLQKGRERSAFLSRITGVDEQGVWEWGFLQMVSTSFVLIQIGEDALAREMLDIAEQWCE